MIITIASVVAIVLISELLSPRGTVDAGILYKPGEKIRTGLFTSVTARKSETYKDEWLDQDNPYRHPTFHD